MSEMKINKNILYDLLKTHFQLTDKIIATNPSIKSIGLKTLDIIDLLVTISCISNLDVSFVNWMTVESEIENIDDIISYIEKHVTKDHVMEFSDVIDVKKRKKNVRVDDNSDRNDRNDS